MQGEYRSSSEDSAGSAAAAAAAAAAAMAPLAAAAAAVAAKEEQVTVAVAPPPLLPLHHHHHQQQQMQGQKRQYRGVRMRKWGKWVAEIREPHKRTRIWLGSYATPVAAARAYDTAVFYLRGRSARLNFPDEISGLAPLSSSSPTPSDEADGGAGALSAASIRKKAIEVGSRVDALQTGMMPVPAAAPQPPPAAAHHRERPLKPRTHSQEAHDEEELLEQQHQKLQRTAWNGRAKNPDLNQAPSPDSSDAD